MAAVLGIVGETNKLMVDDQIFCRYCSGCVLIVHSYDFAKSSVGASYSGTVVLKRVSRVLESGVVASAITWVVTSVIASVVSSLVVVVLVILLGLSLAISIVQGGRIHAFCEFFEFFRNLVFVDLKFGLRFVQFLNS